MAIPKASVTYWNRLEPRPRSASIRRSLAAQVRDPLWMLGRQWQMGEFQGEDAGSAAFVEVSETRSPMMAWRARGGEARPLYSAGPLEKALCGEPPLPDLSLRVELGQVLEGLLAREGAGRWVTDLRNKYPIPAVDEADREEEYAAPAVDEADLAGMQDQEQARFLRVCAGRAIDGVAVYAALEDLVASAGDQGFRRALERFSEWVRQVWGPPGADSTADPPAWRPERLAYEAEVVVTTPDDEPGVLAARPNAEGGLDWYSLDLRPGGTVDPSTPRGQAESFQWRMLPANLRFRGMPKARWWEFEDGTTDFGEIAPDKRDLARLVLIDFMLIHSNDWFIVPIEMGLGSLCRIDALVVHDVFGGLTQVARADSNPAEGWSLFSIGVEGKPSELAGFFAMPPTAAAALQAGPTLEEVQFLRDEMANMAWAVEHLTEDGTGQPWPGHERALAGGGAPTPEGTPAPVNPQVQPGLVYSIQAEVPEHWLPLVPVLVDADGREVALERVSLYRTEPGGDQTSAQPLGRILRPAVSPYHIHEEEVPRSGLRVKRTLYRSRWIDGSTHVWVARHKEAGRGEGRSGLRFDRAEPAGAGGEG